MQILNKLLPNQIYQYIKRIIYLNLVRFIPAMEEVVNIYK